MAIQLYKKNDSGVMEAKNFEIGQFEEMLADGWRTSSEAIEKNEEILERISADKKEMEDLRSNAKEIGYERYQVANKPTLRKVLEEHNDNED